MVYNTHCLVCHRAGRGWSIDQIIINDHLVLGKTLMENFAPTRNNHGGFLKWVNDTKRNTWKTEPCLVSAVYLYNLEAPGQWCQIFWECPDENTASKLRSKLKSRLMDISGYYLLDNTLDSLTKQEIAYYQSTIIDA